MTDSTKQVSDVSAGVSTAEAPRTRRSRPDHGPSTRGRRLPLLATLPERYSPNYVEKLDRRTAVGRTVVERVASLEQDQGGADTLSHARRSLVRRAVFLEVLVESQELRMLDGEALDAGAYTQCLNSLLGVYRALGIERRVKPAKRLRDAVGGGAS